MSPGPSWEPVIFAAVILSSLAACVLLVAKALHLLATRRVAYARTRSGRFGEAAVLCLCVGAIAVAVGDMSGFDTRPTRPCAAARAERDGALSYRDGANAGITIESRAFLPSTVCRWPDGGTVELVPSWVAPLTLLSLAGAALCAVCGVRPPPPASRS